MQKPKKGIPRLLEFAGKHKYLLVVSGVFSAISAVVMLMPFVFIWMVIREVIGVLPDISALDLSAVLRYGWFAVGSAVLGFLLNFAALMFSHVAAFYTARNMKSQALHHILKLPLGYFSVHSSGELRKIIDENAGQTETFLAHQIPDLIASYITPFVILILLFSFDWRLGILSLIPLVIAFLIQMTMTSQESAKFLKRYQNSLEDMNREAVEYVRGIPVVKVFQQTVYSFKSLHDAIQSYREFVTAYTLSWKMPMTLFTTIVNGTFVFLLPAGILFALHAPDYARFLQDLIFYLMFAPACATLLNKVMYATSYKMMAEESVQRIDAILAEKPLAVSKHPEQPRGADILFSEVSFSYPNASQPALQDISFAIPEGHTVALVGPSGGGKTTAASLIPRFWDIDSGSLTIGGAQVRNIPAAELMRRIAFVFQDTHLFKDSVRNNVRFARQDASDAEVDAALRAAQCEDILQKLPQGLDTVIGAKGVYLSGGEQQRIALARAILKDAPIIVLDEATAFADPENEHKIQAAFEKLTKGKTVLLIAHRLSTVQNADEILVLSEGSIAERGTHDSLLAQNGVYAELWKNYQSSITWNVGKGAHHAS